MHWFFDGLIFGFLIIDIFLIATLIHQLVHLRVRHRMKWHGAAVIAALIVTGTCGGLVVYGSFIEPHIVVVHHQTLNFQSDAKHTLRIGFISDLHASSYLSDDTIRRTVAKLKAEKPDVIVIGGDFISGQNREAARLEDFGRILPPGHTFAVFGNHDYIENADTLRPMLESFGIQFLKNEHTIVEKDGGKLALVGVDDLWFGHPDINQASAGISSDIPQILVAHNPDIVYALENYRPKAIFAAHTHGGQIRLPFIGPIPPIPTALGRHWDRGLFYWKEKIPLLITQGIGETGPRARLFAPPEVMIVDVKF